MVVSLAPFETGGRGQTASAQPKSSERTSQEDLKKEPSEEEGPWRLVYHAEVLHHLFAPVAESGREHNRCKPVARRKYHEASTPDVLWSGLPLSVRGLADLWLITSTAMVTSTAIAQDRWTKPSVLHDVARSFLKVK